MPRARTINDAGPEEPQTDSFGRSCRSMAEAQHLQDHHRLFAEPFRIIPHTIPISSETAASPANDVDRLVRWEPIKSNEIICKTVSQLTAEDCRYFFSKDCGLYIVSATQSNREWRMRLYETIYRRWFANRAEDLDISHGSFFCRPLTLHAAPDSNEVVPLSDVVRFHDTLRGKLREAVEDMPEEVPRPHFQPIERSMHLPPARYCVRETFERCFVVMRGEWGDHELNREVTKDRGVLVVFRSVEDAEKHGCLEGNEVADGVRDVTGEYQEVGEARVIRCDSLELAMKIVLASDPNRDGNEPEWHGGYEEVLDPEDTTPLWLCNCNTCGHDRRTDGPVHEPRFF